MSWSVPRICVASVAGGLGVGAGPGDSGFSASSRESGFDAGLVALRTDDGDGWANEAAEVDDEEEDVGVVHDEGVVSDAATCK
jgi:hypothetical protein